MTGVRPSFRAVCSMLPAPWNCPSNAPDAGSRMEDARDSWLAALVRTPLKASMTTAAEVTLPNISLMNDLSLSHILELTTRPIHWEPRGEMDGFLRWKWSGLRATPFSQDEKL